MGYFNIEFKPTFTGINGLQDKTAAAFGTQDVFFDWETVDFPGGVIRIHGATVVARGTNGAAQGFKFQLLFAHLDQSDGNPISIGDVHDTASGLNYYNHLCGSIVLEPAAGGTDYMSIRTEGGTDGNYDGHLVVDTTVRRNLAQDKLVPNMDRVGKLALAAIHTSGSADFNTGVLTDGAQSAATTETTFDVTGTDPRKVFMKGDLIHAHDDAAIGRVTATTNTTITVDAVAGALASGDEIAHNNPIKINLHCEMT